MYTREGFIMLPLGCYPFGVEAYGRGSQQVELHGGYATLAEAEAKRIELLDEFDDYQYVRVVKIETVEPSPRDRAPGV